MKISSIYLCLIPLSLEVCIQTHERENRQPAHFYQITRDRNRLKSEVDMKAAHATAALLTSYKGNKLEIQGTILMPSKGLVEGEEPEYDYQIDAQAGSIRIIFKTLRKPAVTACIANSKSTEAVKVVERYENEVVLKVKESLLEGEPMVIAFWATEAEPAKN